MPTAIDDSAELSMQWVKSMQKLFESQVDRTLAPLGVRVKDFFISDVSGEE